MDVTPLIPQGRQIIQSYRQGGFKISGQVYDCPVIVLPTGTTVWDIHPAFSEINEQSFDLLVGQADSLDVVLFGTGSRSEFFPPALRGALKKKNLVIDAMDTGAACRTYNVLMAEGRRVAAALLPLS